MKKIFLLTIVTFSLYGTLFAQNLDYRQVIFGNSYEQINEINADEFFKQYPQVKSRNSYEDAVRQWFDIIEKPYMKVYEQTIGMKTFYRVLFFSKKLNTKQLIDWQKVHFVQYLFFKQNDGSLLLIGDCPEFGGDVVTTAGGTTYEGYEIIHRNNNVIGIMVFYLTYYNPIMGYGGKSIDSWGRYSLFNDVLEYAVRKEGQIEASPFNINSKIPYIIIEASNPLIDSKRPFMYTIQNAFDGNPATSYVEDTEDDLFEIKGQFNRYFTINKLLIVNGYAASETLYKANNRIKDFFFGGTLKPGDELLEEKFYEEMRHKQIEDVRKKQLITFIPVSIKSFLFSPWEVYSGTTYNDTCIAELNFFTEEQGWLFGAWEN